MTHLENATFGGTAVLFVLLALGCGGAFTEPDVVDPGTPMDPDVVGPSTPAEPEVDRQVVPPVTLREGLFWEYYVQAESSHQAPGVSRSDRFAGAVRLTLDAPVQVGAYRAYPLTTTRIGEAGLDAPTHVAIDGAQLLGSRDGGETWGVLVDGETGEATGFFSSILAETPVQMQPSVVDDVLLPQEFRGQVARFSGNVTNECVTANGITVCSNDDTWSRIRDEYFVADLGPVSYEEEILSEFTGSFPSFGQVNARATLIATNQPSPAASGFLQDYPWRERAAMPALGWIPGLDQVSVYEGKLYMIGNQCEGRVVVYDPQVDRWSDLTTLPSELIRDSRNQCLFPYSFVAAAGHLWILGGSYTTEPGRFPEDVTEQVWSFDLTTRVWARNADLLRAQPSRRFIDSGSIRSTVFGDRFIVQPNFEAEEALIYDAQTGESRYESLPLSAMVLAELGTPRLDKVGPDWASGGEIRPLPEGPFEGGLFGRGGNRVYAAVSGGMLFALDASDPQADWLVSVPFPTGQGIDYVFVVEDTLLLFAGDDDGRSVYGAELTQLDAWEALR